MKQYTDKDQTAKLIELGFPKPKPSFYQNGATWIQCDGNYSIGELIDALFNMCVTLKEEGVI